MSMLICPRSGAAVRTLEARMDAVHHLAWLAIHRHDEAAHGGMCCSAPCQEQDAYDILSTASAATDPGPCLVAKPADYIAAALDLLNLAIADEDSPKRARELRKAADVLVDVERRARRVVAR